MSDYHWANFPGLVSHSVAQIDASVNLAPDIAIGSTICSNCETGHVFVNALIGSAQIAIGFDPDRARDIAMALLAAADRIDPQVKQ